MAHPTGTDPGRRAGRPRRSTRPIDGSARAEILAVAARLFSERGVGATSMAEIARKSGLQQSSLYYYFRNKEQVLDELVAEANRAPLALVAQVRSHGGTPAVQLYRIIRADVMALCALPYDINEVHRLAGRDPDGFARYWQDRDVLLDQVAAVITDGIDTKQFRAIDPRLMALTVLSDDEATQNWIRSANVGRNAAAVGAFLAEFTVRSLLADPTGLDAVRAEADALDARAVLET